MSGFLALLGGHPSVHADTVVRRAARELLPRSPDGLALWRAGGTTLVQGGLRLFAGDAACPAVAVLGDTRVACDARLDARDDLRAELRRALPAHPSPTTDAGLILAAYRAWGEDCVAHLQGDFGFVVWDALNRRAFAAVDHFGVRQVRYCALPAGGVAISNSLASLRSLPGVSAAIDERAVADYLWLGLSLDLSATLYSAIQRLPAGHRMTWSEGHGPRTSAYWRLEPLPELRLPRAGDYVERFREILAAAVSDRLRGTPVAIELSGGLDSPLLAAFAKRELESRGVVDGVRAWCYSHESAFPDPEPAWAATAASHLEIPLRVLDSASVPALADPGTDTPLQPMATVGLAIAGEMLGHSRLALTGFDGDALLRVRLASHWRQVAHTRSARRLARELAALATVGVHSRRVPRMGLRSALRSGRTRPAPMLPTWVRPDFAARNALEERVAALSDPPPAGGDPRECTRSGLRSPTLAALFESYDAGTTGLPQVVVHPLMDLRVVGFIQSLPPVPWCVEKHLLRRAGAGLLPPPLLRRPKTPLVDDPLAYRGAEILAAFERPGIAAAVAPWGAIEPGVDYGASWELARLASLARWIEWRSHDATGPAAFTHDGEPTHGRCIAEEAIRPAGTDRVRGYA